MKNKRLLKRFKEYDANKPEKVTEISGLLGIPINGSLQVEVPTRNGFVYVRLRNNTNELIQAFNEKVSPVYGLPVLVAFKNNRYEVQGRDTSRYSDWGSFSSAIPKHGSQHSLNFENGQGGDVTWVYSRQMMPFAVVPSGTEGAGTVFVMPHVYRNPVDASWNYIGDVSSPSFLPAKPTGTSARMMLLYWDLDATNALIATGTHLAEGLTGTSAVLTVTPVVTNSRHIPLAGIRLVSGTHSILWNNIYDLRQWATTTPATFDGGFAVWDEGVPVGTGRTIDFVGEGVNATLSGSVVRVFVSGTAGTQFAGVDQIGIFAQDEGIPIGTGTIINFVGNNVDVSRSGTVLRVFVTGSTGGQAPVQTDGFLVQDEGILLGTGTILNFVGDSVQATISGTVVKVEVTATGGGGGGGVVGQRLGNYVQTGTVLNVLGSLTASGTVLRLNAQKYYKMDVGSAWGNMPAADTIMGDSSVLADLFGYTQCRLAADWGGTSPATASGTYLHLKYSLNNGTGYSEAAVNPTRDGILRWVANTNAHTGWFDIVPEMQVDDVRIVLWGTGGNGTADPTFGTLSSEFR